EHRDEAPVAAREIAKVPAHRYELRVGCSNRTVAANHDELACTLELGEARADLVLAMRGMGEHATSELAEAEPRQLLAHILAELLECRRHDDERPLPVPGIGCGAVDALRRLGEARATGRGESVVARASASFRAHPFFVRESSDRRTNQALREP